MSDDAKITLYTNRRCPWAHRAHIVLAELGIPFDEVTIDLTRPRDPWYLEVNPRGLVPSLKHGDSAIVTESAIVAQFLADAYAHKAPWLTPPPGTAAGALARARIAFFVDTFFTKAQSVLFRLGAATTAAEQAAVGEAFVAAVAKEVEPLLAGTAAWAAAPATSAAAPFFGGSARLTLAEVLTGSFVLRVVSLAKLGVYPAGIPALAAAQTPAFWAWAQAVAAHPSVNGIYDEAAVAATTKERLEKQRAAAA